MKSYDNGPELPSESFAACGGIAGFVFPMGYFAINFFTQSSIADEWIRAQAICYSSCERDYRRQRMGKCAGKLSIYAKFNHTCTRLSAELFGLKIVLVAFAAGVGKDSTLVSVLFVIPSIFWSFSAVLSHRFQHAKRWGKRKWRIEWINENVVNILGYVRGIP